MGKNIPYDFFMAIVFYGLLPKKERLTLRPAFPVVIPIKD
jgi:hypothetical protein